MRVEKSSTSKPRVLVRDTQPVYYRSVRTVHGEAGRNLVIPLDSEGATSLVSGFHE